MRCSGHVPRPGPLQPAAPLHRVPPQLQPRSDAIEALATIEASNATMRQERALSLREYIYQMAYEQVPPGVPRPLAPRALPPLPPPFLPQPPSSAPLDLAMAASAAMALRRRHGAPAPAARRPP